LQVGKIRLSRFSNFFTRGNARSLKAKNNILGLIIFRGALIVTGFIRMPILLSYLDQFSYGIWLTISSVIGWLAFFDIGLGNGLRNKLAEALAMNDKRAAQTYVSTTYAMLFFIGIIISIFSFSIISSIKISAFLNAPESHEAELQTVVAVVLAFFILRFIFQLINIVFLAHQRTALPGFYTLVEGVLFLIAIWWLEKETASSLLYISLASGITSLIVLILTSFFYFSRAYKEIAPKWKCVSFKNLKELGSLGSKFFLIQIAVLIIFSTDNMIITHILGPEEVVPYNVAFKFFSIISMGFGIIMQPLWSAYTEAYIKSDILWIKNAIRRTLQVWFVAFVGVFFLVSISNTVYGVWFSQKIEIPILLSFSMGAFVLFQSWNMIFVHFTNAIGKVRLQLFSALLAALINIPISIYFAEYLELGSAGVILGSCVSLSFAAVLAPIQCWKILNMKATGIWAK